MKQSSLSSSTTSSSSSITSLSSADGNSNNNNNNKKKNLSTNNINNNNNNNNNTSTATLSIKKNGSSGSFTILNEKSLSLSSTSASSQQTDTVDTSAGGSNSSSSGRSSNDQSSEQTSSKQEEANPNEDEPPLSIENNHQQTKAISSSDFVRKLEADYDGELDKIGDRATDAVAKGSFFNFGLFQVLSFLFISIAWTVGNGWYAYVSVFTGYSPTHECDYEQMGGNLTRLPANHSLLDHAGDDPDSVLNCWAFNPADNSTHKCTHWKFDKSQMHSTIITEYGFVCDKNYYFELAYSLEQIGYIVGTLVFSFVADLVGRKPVLVAVLWSMCACGFVQYFVDSFLIYIIIGFVINSLACGLEAVCVTLVLEMFSTSKRTIFGIGIQVVWVIVLASMAPLAYAVKQWREIRLIIFATLAILSVFSTLLVQESIRWLISISRLDACLKTIDRVAVFNRLRWTESSANDESNSSSEKAARRRRFEARRKKLAQMFAELDAYNRLHAKKEVKNESSYLSSVSKPQLKLALEMFKNGKFRLYVLIMALNWFATALVYDGLAYLNNYIGENIFLNWIAMNLIELPAQFVCYYLISRSGRRVTVALTLVIAGVTLLGTLLVEFAESFMEKPSESGLSWMKLILFVLAKFVITQSYSAIIVHAPELFPTSLRSFGYGICLFSGKITAVLSPIISFYVSKIAPSLPALIYGSLSILCGLVSLYVPETLNRALPNSVDDVVKWPRTLSADEWKVVRKLNDNELKLMFKCCYKLKSSKRTAPVVARKSNVTGTTNIDDSDEQQQMQKCVYGAQNTGQILVVSGGGGGGVISSKSSAAVLVEEQETATNHRRFNDDDDDDDDNQQTIVI